LYCGWEDVIVRLGAAIIVVIGVCLACLILLERSIGAKLQEIEMELESKNRGDTTKLEEQRSNFAGELGIYAMLDVSAIIVLTACFINVSRRKFRRPLRYAEPPKDELEAMRRLSDQARLPFQFGILTLLALMLAVAIVCSAIVYPLNR
jgi:hypothetical protein